MTDTGIGATGDARHRANDRFIAPGAGDIRDAGWLSVVAGTLRPVQAAAIAWVVSGWAEGVPPIERVWSAARIFVAGAVLRATLEHVSVGLLFRAADRTIARERAALIAREARLPAEAGSASIAALVTQKLPLLQPWITRYRVALMRAAVLPVFLLALAFSQSWVVGLTLLVAGP